MSQDRVFVGAVLAAALWFILNPDFKSRTVGAADRDAQFAARRAADKAALNAALEDFQKRTPAPIGASAGAFAGSAGAAKVGAPLRETRENILVELRAKEGGCEATVVEAPELVGTTLEGPAWDCELAIKIRGSAIFDPQTQHYSGFTPNVGHDDPPYDRAILARWENYGGLCPNGDCARTELVVLGDGAVQVRAGPEVFPVELGKLEKSDVDSLKALNGELAPAPYAEMRIADPKTSETVSMRLVHDFRLNAFLDADFLHASLRYPMHAARKAACLIVQRKTPVHFCELLDEEPVAAPSPGATGKPPIVTHGPGGPNGNPRDPHSPNHGPSPRPMFTLRPPTGPGAPTGPGNPPVIIDPAPPRNGPSTSNPSDPRSNHPRGYTWNNTTPAGLSSGYVAVGCHGAHECNAYQGDTDCTSVHPMICIRKAPDLSPPTSVPPELQNQYFRWAGAEVKLLPGVVGTSLSSVEAANAKCAAAFGSGWRMAEHHDGWGWGFIARGSLSKDDHFWVGINDQPANCWNSN